MPPRRALRAPSAASALRGALTEGSVRPGLAPPRVGRPSQAVSEADGEATGWVWSLTPAVCWYSQVMEGFGGPGFQNGCHY